MCPFISGVGVSAGGHVPPVPPHVAGPVNHVIIDTNITFLQRDKIAHTLCDPLTNIDGIFGKCLAYFDGKTLHDACIKSVCTCKEVSIWYAHYIATASYCDKSDLVAISCAKLSRNV